MHDPHLYPITIFVGICFDLPFGWKDENGSPHDFTGYQARMDVRLPDGTLLIRLTTANGRIALDGSEWNVRLHIDESDTAALIPSNNAEWDLILDAPDGCALKFPLEGRAMIRKTKTQ